MGLVISGVGLEGVARMLSSNKSRASLFGKKYHGYLMIFYRNYEPKTSRWGIQIEGAGWVCATGAATKWGAIRLARRIVREHEREATND